MNIEMKIISIDIKYIKLFQFHVNVSTSKYIMKCFVGVVWYKRKICDIVGSFWLLGIKIIQHTKKKKT